MRKSMYNKLKEALQYLFVYDVITDDEYNKLRGKLEIIYRFPEKVNMP